MSTHYIIEYKCRRCGEVWDGYWYTRKGDAGYALSEGTAKAPKEKIHSCEDGGMGRADSVGAKKMEGNVCGHESSTA